MMRVLVYKGQIHEIVDMHVYDLSPNAIFYNLLNNKDANNCDMIYNFSLHQMLSLHFHILEIDNEINHQQLFQMLLQVKYLFYDAMAQVMLMLKLSLDDVSVVVVVVVDYEFRYLRFLFHLIYHHLVVPLNYDFVVVVDYIFFVHRLHYDVSNVLIVQQQVNLMIALIVE
jgi:hypothetical protein